ncbi:hypothetical protein JTE90_011838 [Oedothorax gibbosus]|uniref:sn-1-specific diacylglycerol lipase ABHD11 n=1 Tax=Oedothorax gibbosus TaxID=931172 RepID=A0AAV6U2J6_9ARAC|nr:hypothetical protein JTE90_011838 [Oedothorax gibbosus]
MIRSTPVPLSFICVQPDDGKCSDSPPIVFLHGLCRFKANWGSIPQEVANATQRKVYVIDARNHGDSEWCDEFTFDKNSEDLLHFMDYIGAPKATLVGHSMGGLTSIKTALRAPERVENLVIEDMYVKRIPQTVTDDIVKYLNLMGKATDEIQPEVDESTAKNMIGKNIMNQYPDAENYEKRDHQGDFDLKRKSDGRYYHSCNVDAIVKAMSDNETLMTENTGEFCGPTAFIYGGKSPFKVGEDEENIKGCFPNAEIIKIDEADHEVHYEFPAQFTEALLGFLNK